MAREGIWDLGKKAVHMCGAGARMDGVKARNDREQSATIKTKASQSLYCFSVSRSFLPIHPEAVRNTPKQAPLNTESIPWTRKFKQRRPGRHACTKWWKERDRPADGRDLSVEVDEPLGDQNVVVVG